MTQKKRKRTGLPPGAVVFTGKKKVDTIDIHYLEYNDKECNEKQLDNYSIDKVYQPITEYVQWFDIRGLHDTALIEKVGTFFNVHTLIMEDVADTQQRPKFDEYDDGFVLTLKALSFDNQQNKIHIEQVTLYCGDGYLLTFQEDATDLFADIRKRIVDGRGRIRLRKADYLAYALIDVIVDHYYVVLDKVEACIESIETEITNNASPQIKSDIHSLKQEMLIVRKSVAPLREAIARFAKSEHDVINDSTVFFLRDLQDHTIQVMDMIETYRDMLNSLQDLYLSEISFKMNQVMQVLTVITTIFVPLSFLTGLYGMNFEYIPELGYRNGYFVLWGVMLVLVVLLLVWFRKKRWL